MKKILKSIVAVSVFSVLTCAYAEDTAKTVKFTLENSSHSAPLAIVTHQDGGFFRWSYKDEKEGVFLGEILSATVGSLALEVWPRDNPTNKCFFEATFTVKSTSLFSRREGNAFCNIEQNQNGFFLKVDFPGRINN